MKSTRFKSRFTFLALVLCTGTALALVIRLGLWGADRDINEIRISFLQGEVNRIRSHAERSVGQLEGLLNEDGGPAELATICQTPWLRSHWNRVIKGQPDGLYAAIVDRYQVLLGHSDAATKTRQLIFTDDYEPIEGLGDQVARVRHSKLAGGAEVIDVAVPIVLGGREAGVYHSGIRPERLEARIAEASGRTLQVWRGLMAVISLIVILSSIVLYRIAAKSSYLESELAMAHARRIREVGQVMVGLAHEIRNPLNAIQMNLHVARKVAEGQATLPPGEFAQMLDESSREVERVESMMREMLGYVRAAEDCAEVVDLAEEVRTTLQFLKTSHQEDGFHVTVLNDKSPIPVRMDRLRLHQVLLNLLQNARDAAGPQGRAMVSLSCTRETASLAISDNGPGVSPQQQEQIFEPFYSTKEQGTGMGLPLVRKHVEEAGGEVRCFAGQGGRFQVTLPICTEEFAE